MKRTKALVTGSGAIAVTCRRFISNEGLEEKRAAREERCSGTAKVLSSRGVGGKPSITASAVIRKNQEGWGCGILLRLSLVQSKAA